MPRCYDNNVINFFINLLGPERDLAVDFEKVVKIHFK